MVDNTYSRRLAASGIERKPLHLAGMRSSPMGDEWSVGVGKGLLLAAPRRQQVYYDR